MRGSLSCTFQAPALYGIIPAHAGLTGTGAAHTVASRDHPRACGAHLKPWARKLKEKGSSPRMRGSHLVRDKAAVKVGIIPAHAGLTNRLRR